MRLDEITKGEFVDKLSDPAVAELKALNKQIEKELNLDGVLHNLTTKTDPRYGTRRTAVVVWSFRNVANKEAMRFARIDQKIVAHYTHELEHWGVKGWEASNEQITYELMEGGW